MTVNMSASLAATAIRRPILTVVFVIFKSFVHRNDITYIELFLTFHADNLLFS